jgi:hypothetical protein
MYHWFQPDTSPVENAHALRALLDCLIAVNQSYLRFHPSTPDLYKSGVVYERVTEWLPIPALYRLGVGDCKSLACALIAQYRAAGIACDPSFRWIERPHSDEMVRDFHILVEIAPGMKFEDPSKILGMGANEVEPIRYVEDPEYFGAEDRARMQRDLRALKIF